MTIKTVVQALNNRPIGDSVRQNKLHLQMTLFGDQEIRVIS